jgi:hypothetical protein
VSKESVNCVDVTPTKLQLKSDEIGALLNAVCIVTGTGIGIIPASPATNENTGTPIKCRTIQKIQIRKRATEKKNVYFNILANNVGLIGCTYISIDYTYLISSFYLLTSKL